MNAIAVFAMVAAQVAPAAPKLTLDDAVKIGLQNSYSVRTAVSQYQSLRQRVFEAEGTLGPQVTLQDVYTTYDVRVSMGSGSYKDSNAASANVSMVLDVSGRLSSGVRGSKALLGAGLASIEAARNDVVSSIRQSYFQALQAQEIVTVQQLAVQQAKESLANTQAAFDAGAKAKVDVLRFQAQLAQSQSDLIAAQNAAALAREALNNAMSRPIDTDYELAPVTEAPQVSTAATDYVALALSTRPELRNLRLTIQGLRDATRAISLGLAPTVALSGGYSSNHASGFTHNTVGVASISWPIFDSGVTKARTAEARESERQAQIGLEQTQLAVSLEVNQAVTNIVNAKSAMDVAQQQVAFSEEAYRLARLRYDAGSAILVEVTTAQTQLTQAKTTLVNARYSYLIALASLRRAIGTDDLEAKPTQAAGTMAKKPGK